MRIVSISSEIPAIPMIARWYHDEWAYMHPGTTAEDIVIELEAQTRTEALPQLYVAVSGSKVVGAAELKLREVESLPRYKYWLGGVYVDSDSRGAGIASELASHVASVARDRHAATRLYLQTERLDGGLYAKLGWRSLGPLRSDGKDRIVMARDLAVEPRTAV